MNEYLTINKQSRSELVVERSRFIAVLAHVETEEEAMEFISSKRSEHYDARHNVYAYRLSNGTARFSDDGEPHSTAGKPIMDVLTGAGLFNVVAVVTRYFGGVLLGTGGLVRAYSSSIKNAVDAAEIVRMTECAFLNINCDYSYLEPVRTYLESNNCKISEIQYEDTVKINFTVESGLKDIIIDKITEAFSGRIVANIEKIEFSAL